MVVVLVCGSFTNLEVPELFQGGLENVFWGVGLVSAWSSLVRTCFAGLLFVCNVLGTWPSIISEKEQLGNAKSKTAGFMECFQCGRTEHLVTRCHQSCHGKSLRCHALFYQASRLNIEGQQLINLLEEPLC